MSKKSLNSFSKKMIIKHRSVAEKRKKIRRRLDKKAYVSSKEKFNEGSKVVVQSMERLNDSLIGTNSALKKNIKKSSVDSKKFVRNQFKNKLKW